MYQYLCIKPTNFPRTRAPFGLPALTLRPSLTVYSVLSPHMPAPTHQNSLIMPAPVVDCEDEMKNPTLHSRFSKKSSSLIHQSSLRVPEKSRPSNLGQSQPAQFSEDSYIHITSPTNCHPITRFLHLYDIVLTGTLVTCN